MQLDFLFQIELRSPIFLVCKSFLYIWHLYKTYWEYLFKCIDPSSVLHKIKTHTALVTALDISVRMMFLPAPRGSHHPYIRIRADMDQAELGEPQSAVKVWRRSKTFHRWSVFVWAFRHILHFYRKHFVSDRRWRGVSFAAYSEIR